MSVFAGGACLDAVKGVCGDDAVPDVLGALSALVDKSLLIPSVPDTGGTEDVHAEDRPDPRGGAACRAG